MTKLPNGGSSVMKPGFLDGESAFPWGAEGNVAKGMTLRDWFASNAPDPLPNTLIHIHPKERPVRPSSSDLNHFHQHFRDVVQWEAEARAIWNYQYADAMLAARGEGAL